GLVEPEAARRVEDTVVVLERLLDRVDARGSGAGSAVIVEGAAVVAGGASVVGGHAGEFVEPVGVQRFDRVERPRMELLAAAAQETAVGRLLDQGVLEGAERDRPAD